MSVTGAGQAEGGGEGAALPSNMPPVKQRARATSSTALEALQHLVELHNMLQPCCRQLNLGSANSTGFVGMPLVVWTTAADFKVSLECVRIGETVLMRAAAPATCTGTQRLLRARWC